MAPKRNAPGGKGAVQDETADVNAPPEHDDDRCILIQVSGSLKARQATLQPSETPRSEAGAFTAALVQPAVALHFPSGIDATVATSAGIPDGGVHKADPFNTAERDFSATLYSRRLQLTANLVAQLLGGTLRLVVCALNEAATAARMAAAAPPVAAPPAKGGGKGAAAPAAAKVKDPNTGRSDGHEAEVQELLSYAFSLSDLFVGKNKTEISFEGKGAIQGFERLTLTISTNAPLLSPTNVLRYPAVFVSINEVRHLPPTQPIDVHRHLQSVSKPVDETESHKLKSAYDGVLVKAKWRAGANVDFVTHRVPHGEHASFNRTFVLFLHTLPKLRMLQSLFHDPITFEIHDRDPKPESPSSPDSPHQSHSAHHDHQPAAPFGVATMSLRHALDGEVRFIGSTQVVATRTSVASTSPDYYSFGTTLKTKIIFTTPLPFVTFVDLPRPQSSQSEAFGGTMGSVGVESGLQPPISGGVGSSDGVITVPDRPGLGAEPCVAFLSRIAIIVPYKSETTSLVIRAVMGVVMEQARPNPFCDVVEIVRKASAPVNEVVAPVKGGKGGKGAAAEALTEEPAAPPPPVLHHPAGGLRQQVLAAVPDNVCGFEIMDGDKRIIVIEGQLPFVSRVAAVAASVSGTDPNVKILFNFELPFLRRSYHVWPPLVVPIVVQAAAPPAEPTEPEAVSPNAKPVAGKGGKGALAAAGKAPAAPPAGKAARVPPIGQAPTPEAPPPPPPVQTSGSDAGELDAGGVGGRLRRIRLKQTLHTTFHTKSHYLHRSLHHDALTCVRRLMDLTQAPDMGHCVDHDCFPSSAEIIALERVAGDCLDTYDVCAADRFYNFAEQNIDDVVAAAVQMQMEAMAERPPQHEVDLSNLDEPESMGRVVSFVALPTPPDEARKLPTLATATRYSDKAYMTEYDTQKYVRCAFSGTPPTQLLRFLVTGQVVPDGNGGGILFVMSCVSLAKKGTDSRNPEFVKKKKADEKLLPASMYFQMKRETRERYEATHKMPDPRKRRHLDDSSDDEPTFVDPAPHSPKHDILSGQHEEDRAAATHFIGLHRRKLAAMSADAAQKRAHEHEETKAKFAKAFDTHEAITRREEQTMRKLTAMRPADDRPSFTTLNQRTALEDVKPKLAPSPSRVDDLKQKWEPPGPSIFQQKGPSARALTFQGAKNCCTSQTFKSVFAETAEERSKREADERRERLEALTRGVVVDDLKFKVACKMPSAHPHIIDKHRGLLADEPKKLSLRQVRLEPAPVSIRDVEKEIPRTRVEVSVTKHPEKRAFYYAKDVLEKLPKIPNMSGEEKQGPLWGGYEPPRFAD